MIADKTDEELIAYIVAVVKPKKIPMKSMVLLVKPFTSKTDDEIVELINSVTASNTKPISVKLPE